MRRRDCELDEVRRSSRRRPTLGTGASREGTVCKSEEIGQRSTGNKPDRVGLGTTAAHKWVSAAHTEVVCVVDGHGSAQSRAVSPWGSIEFDPTFTQISSSHVRQQMLTYADSPSVLSRNHSFYRWVGCSTWASIPGVPSCLFVGLAVAMCVLNAHDNLQCVSAGWIKLFLCRRLSFIPRSVTQ